MVQFLNIRIDGDYVYADAEDRDAKRKFKIKVHKVKEELYTEPRDYTSCIAKASWELVEEINKKGNIEHFSVHWG